MNDVKTINLSRKRTIEIEVFEDGTYGLEMEKDNGDSDEYQYSYFTLTQSELQLIINAFAQAQQTRLNLLKRLPRKVKV